MSYRDELKHPDWQRKRLECYQRDGFKCRLCGAADKQLNLHHLCYAEKGDWRGVPDKFLLTICEDCHAELHGFNQPNHSPGKKSSFEADYANRERIHAAKRQEVLSLNWQSFRVEGKSQSYLSIGRQIEKWLAKEHSFDAPLIFCGRLIPELLIRGILKREDIVTYHEYVTSKNH